MCIDIVLHYRYNKYARKTEKDIERGTNMAVLQVRVDDELKKQASELLEKEGLDLSTAVRMFLKKVVLQRCYPFD